MQQYHDLLGSILLNGDRKEPARENMPGTTSLFGYQTSFDLTKGFPLLTTKRMPFKSITAELLWFLKGETNIKWLKDNGCSVWDDDSFRYFKELFPESSATKEEFLERVKAGCIRKGTSYAYGDLGAVYGYNWRRFNGRLMRRPQPHPKLDPAFNATKLGVANGDYSRGSRLRCTWEGMIDRCYNKSSHSYVNYGGRGVYVCDRWLVFKHFEQDVKLLPGWGNKELLWDRYELDKDIKGDGFVYAPEACIWTSISDNNCGHQYEYTIKKENKEYTFSNISEFARANGLDIGNLSRLVSGNRKSHKGFVLVDVIDRYSGVDQVLDLIMGIRQNPAGRRHIISAWNPSELDNCSLPPCHMFVQFNCRMLTRDQRLAWLEQNFSQSYVDVAKSDFEDVILDIEGAPRFYLDASMYMRSADSFLGVPFNIASYALLTHIVALLTGMTPGKLVMSFGDLHIYDNHHDAVNLQLSRDCNKHQLPTVALGKAYNRSLEAFGKLPEYLTREEVDYFIEQIQVQDFVLNDYNSYHAIKAELSVGLDKPHK